MSATLPAALPSTGTWTVDPIHSTARFSITHHAIATFRAGFENISGAYDAERGILSGVVAVESIDLPGPERFRNHLLSADFFDNGAHSSLTFTSTRITSGPGGKLALDGELTIRGAARPVSATGRLRGPITVRHNDGHLSERLSIDLATTVDRRDFGMTRNNELAEGVLNLGWDVLIEVALELVLS